MKQGRFEIVDGVRISKGIYAGCFIVYHDGEKLFSLPSECAEDLYMLLKAYVKKEREKHPRYGGVAELTDSELFDELRERGYTGKLYKQTEYEV